MLERLAELVNADDRLVLRGRYVTGTVRVDVGDDAHYLDIAAGRVERVRTGPLVMPVTRLVLRAPRAEWAAFWEPRPRPGHGDLMALLRRRVLAVEGDLYLFMANLRYFKDVLEKPRERGGSLVSPVRAATRAVAFTEPVTGRYVHMDLPGGRQRIYVEEAGAGVPLLCLHTAGSDSRQFRHLLNDERVTGRFRVIAFDMPWHGRSSVPAGWRGIEYRLTSDDYAGMVLGVCDALELDRPAVMGCSIGGRIVLRLAREHPERFRALIGLQSGAAVAPYYEREYLHRPDVHGGELCAALMSGLIGPDAPAADRAETLWQYAQGGPGVFQGDLYFYKDQRDDDIASIDTARCPLYLLSGEYDYSCMPEDTLAVAAAVPGARVTIMPGLGHFPMSEDHEAFARHLLPVLEEIAAAG